MTPAHATRASFRIRHVLLAGIVLAFASTPGAAQSTGASASENRQLGPLGLTPTVVWQTEYDDNVFRTAVQPVTDIVSTIGGKTGLRGEAGRISLTGSGSADWVHFSRLDSQRGANVGTALRMDVRFNRVAPYLSTSYSNSRERTNPEVDTRPRVQQSMVAAGAILRLGSKTGLDLGAKRTLIAYGEGAMADGVLLGNALNRASEQAIVSLGQQVTPLTRLAIGGELSRDTFDVSSQNDADNVRLFASFESEGRLTGRVSGGLRVLTPHDPRLSESRGYFLAVNTGWTLHDRLHIGVTGDRDIAPSYRSAVTYYEYYSYGGSLSYAIYRSLRFNAQAARRFSNYEDGLTTTPELASRAGLEIQAIYSSGLTYRVGGSMAIDFSGIYSERTADVASRQYNGMIFRAGVSHVF